jgi:hypothetical protein
MLGETAPLCYVTKGYQDEYTLHQNIWAFNLNTQSYSAGSAFKSLSENYWQLKKS